MSLGALLDQVLTIERPAVAADSSGGTTRTFAAVLTGVACAVSPATAAVVADYARRDMRVDYSIFTTVDLDAVVSGGIRLGDRLTDGSVRYLLKSVKKSANKLVTAEVLYQLDCELLSI